MKFTLTSLFNSCLILIIGASIGCTNQPKSIYSNEARLLYNVQIVDVEQGTLMKDNAILIDSGLIQKIGTLENLKQQIPENQQQDFNRKYVIPGLWDMHVHIEGEDLVPDNKDLLKIYLSYGITTVRDAASDLGDTVLLWRDKINNGQMNGPRIFTAGRKLEGINSIWKGDLEIANVEELDQMLNWLESKQVDFVKITENTLKADLFIESIKRARAKGFKVSGHVPYDATIQQLVDAGFSSIEHASYMLRLGNDEGTIAEQIKNEEITKGEANDFCLENFDQEKAIENYKKLAKAGVAVTPTLIGGKQLAYLDEDDHQDDDYLKYLTSRFKSKYQWRIGRMANDTEEDKLKRKERYQLIAAQLPHLQKASVLLLAGSDAAALNTFVYPALSLHEELTLFQKAGMTPSEILKTATINGAIFLEKEAVLGTITEGKIADLVILNSNPLENIAATQDIYAVVQDGEILDRASLDSLQEYVIQHRTILDSERKDIEQ
jgi:imidazolonepropionase-like amidohydrolase